MSKVLRVIGKVSSVASVVAALTGNPALAAAFAANAQLMETITARGPIARGQVSDLILGANNPQPYLMGRSYSAGVQVVDVGYGGKVNGVQNPYRFLGTVYSCCGPVQELESVQFDYQAQTFSGTAITGYYEDFYWRDFQLGARPEADALTPHFSGAPNWGSSHKLSGFAAIGHSFKWSKRGKRFTGGQVPKLGAIWKGVKVYDPRLDTTYPGGSGPQRVADESTWEYSTNPALHALAYSYGRYVNGVKVFGVDLGGGDVIAADAVIAWANVCDANGWTISGSIYEPVSEGKWNNLKRICQAGGAKPVLKSGVLTFDYQAPRTSLATLGVDDLADGQVSAQMGRRWKDRVNTLVPRYRSEAHQWNYVQSDALDVPAWVTADGEVKSTELQFDLVDKKDQAAQLGMYELYQMREAGPFSLAFKPHLRIFGPGDALTLDAALGVHPDGEIKVVISARTIDPVSGVVTLEFEKESDAKHTIALAVTGTAPDTITLPTAAQIDAAAANNTGDFGPTADATNVTADSTQFTADQT